MSPLSCDLWLYANGFQDDSQAIIRLTSSKSRPYSSAYSFVTCSNVLGPCTSSGRRTSIVFEGIKRSTANTIIMYFIYALLEGLTYYTKKQDFFLHKLKR